MMWRRPALLAVPPASAAAVRTRLQTPIGAKLLSALTDYGGYLDDNTASDRGAFNVEQGVEAEVIQAYGQEMRLNSTMPGTALYDDLLKIYQALHVVDNNSPENIGGGGVPRQPAPPPICGLQ